MSYFEKAGFSRKMLPFIERWLVISLLIVTTSGDLRAQTQSSKRSSSLSSSVSPPFPSTEGDDKGLNLGSERTNLDKYLTLAAKYTESARKRVDEWGFISCSEPLIVTDLTEFKGIQDSTLSTTSGYIKSEQAAINGSDSLVNSTLTQQELSGSLTLNSPSTAVVTPGLPSNPTNVQLISPPAVPTPIPAPSNLSTPQRAAIISGIGDKEAELFSLFQVNPDKKALMDPSMTLCLGIVQVSCSPGWRTKKNYIADLNISFEYGYQLVAQKNKKTYERIVPSLFWKHQLQPMVFAVLPLVDSQSLQLSNDRQHTLQLLANVLASLPATTASGQVQSVTNYLRTQAQLASTSNSIPVISSYTTSTGAGFRFSPSFAAVKDTDDPDSAAGNVMQPASFPAAILFGCHSNDQIDQALYLDNLVPTNKSSKALNKLVVDTVQEVIDLRRLDCLKNLANSIKSWTQGKANTPSALDSDYATIQEDLGQMSNDPVITDLLILIKPYENANPNTNAVVEALIDDLELQEKNFAQTFRDSSSTAQQLEVSSGSIQATLNVINGIVKNPKDATSNLASSTAPEQQFTKDDDFEVDDKITKDLYLKNEQLSLIDIGSLIEIAQKPAASSVSLITSIQSKWVRRNDTWFFPHISESETDRLELCKDLDLAHSYLEAAQAVADFSYKQLPNYPSEEDPDHYAKADPTNNQINNTNTDLSANCYVGNYETLDDRSIWHGSYERFTEIAREIWDLKNRTFGTDTFQTYLPSSTASSASSASSAVPSDLTLASGNSVAISSTGGSSIVLVSQTQKDLSNAGINGAVLSDGKGVNFFCPTQTIGNAVIATVPNISNLKAAPTGVTLSLVISGKPNLSVPVAVTFDQPPDLTPVVEVHRVNTPLQTSGSSTTAPSNTGSSTTIVANATTMSASTQSGGSSTSSQTTQPSNLQPMDQVIDISLPSSIINSPSTNTVTITNTNSVTNFEKYLELVKTIFPVDAQHPGEPTPNPTPSASK